MDKTFILLAFEYILRTLIVVLGATLLAFIRKYNLEKWVNIGVYAAEQMFEAGLIDIPKKEYVIQFINDRFKFKINEDELDALIEAAVHEMNTVKKLNESSTHVVNVN